jgi:hypothetical protein
VVQVAEVIVPVILLGDASVTVVPDPALNPYARRGLANVSVLEVVALATPE